MTSNFSKLVDLLAHPVVLKLVLGIVSLTLRPFVRLDMSASNSCDLVLDRQGFLIETGIRIWDLRSLIHGLSCIDYKLFGQLRKGGYKVRLPNGEVIPLLTKRRIPGVESEIDGRLEQAHAKGFKSITKLWEVNPELIKHLILR